jgi:hypothetical protein
MMVIGFRLRSGPFEGQQASGFAGGYLLVIPAPYQSTGQTAAGICLKDWITDQVRNDMI